MQKKNPNPAELIPLIFLCKWLVGRENEFEVFMDTVMYSVVSTRQVYVHELPGKLQIIQQKRFIQQKI